jgi:vesicle-fusing ATPase
MAFGKLLYGGVKRYRMIGSVRKRRAGERSLVYDKTVKSWLQYGGPERNYEAIDMGPCGLVELILTPTGLSLPLLSDEGEESMAVSKVGFDPRTMFDFVSINETNDTVTHTKEELDNDAFSETGQSHIDALHSTFSSSVGGLQPQIQSIVRRVLDGRVVRPVQDLQVDDTNAHRIRTEEARALAELGLQPVRGLLLYGPPGCGKVRMRIIASCTVFANPLVPYTSVSMDSDSTCA